MKLNHAMDELEVVGTVFPRKQLRIEEMMDKTIQTVLHEAPTVKIMGFP